VARVKKRTKAQVDAMVAKGARREITPASPAEKAASAAVAKAQAATALIQANWEEQIETNKKVLRAIESLELVVNVPEPVVIDRPQDAAVITPPAPRVPSPRPPAC